MDLGLRGRNYVVLGGTRGVGWETVRLLAEEGANVAILSRNPGAVEVQAKALAGRHGVSIDLFAADAAKPGAVEGAVSSIIKRLGAVRGLAVTNHWMGEARTFEGVGDGEWEAYFQNSLMGAVRAARAILPHLAEQGGGSLVLTTAFSSRAPKANIAAYAAFKAALNNLTKSLAKAYGPSAVRVNAVAPGAIRTGRYEQRFQALQEERPDIGRADAEKAMLESLGMSVALERIGDPAEVADLIAFLLSERAGYATGLIANIDGGTDF